jgi:periplasmic protein TonB
MAGQAYAYVDKAFAVTDTVQGDLAIASEDDGFPFLHATKNSGAKGDRKSLLGPFAILLAVCAFHIAICILFDFFETAPIGNLTPEAISVDLVTDLPSEKQTPASPKSSEAKSQAKDLEKAQEKGEEKREKGEDKSQPKSPEKPQEQAQNPEPPKPVPEPPKPAPEPPKPAPEPPKPAPEPPKPAPEPPKPAPEPPKPAPEPPKPAPERPKPAPEPPKPEAAKPLSQKAAKVDNRKAAQLKTLLANHNNLEPARPQTELHSEPFKQPIPPPSPAEAPLARDLPPSAPALFSMTSDNFRAVALPPTSDDGEDVLPYQRIVFSRLELAKQSLETAWLRGARGSAGIGFTLDKDGKVLDVELLVSSGNSDIDEQSVALVRRAEPFPTPPTGEQARITAVVSFDQAPE